MTDYEKDYYNWKHDQSKFGDFIEAPDRNDYDKNGNRKKSVINDNYEDKLVLDPYLIKLYGYEYAKQNPIRRL